MNERAGASDFARTLSDWLDDLAPDREPPDLLSRVLEQTAATSRRPPWWRPLGSLEALLRPRFLVGRAVALGALVLLLALAMVVALGVASRPQLPRPLGRPGLIVVGQPGLLQLVDPSAGVVRQVATGDMFGAGNWSPDGTRLARAEGLPTDPFLVISGPDLVQQLRIHLPLAADSWFSWSPDGRRIAFDTETDTSAQVFVVDVAAGAEAVPITDIALHAIRPSWSPDGAWLALRGGIELDKQALYVVHPDGTGMRRLSQAARAVNPWCGFPWTPDGRTILFETAYNGVWSVNVDGSDERMVVGGAEQAYCPTISPDGTQMTAAVDNGFGKQIVIAALDGSSRVVPQSPGFYSFAALWSPDGKSIAVTTGEPTGKQGPIAIFDAKGLNPARFLPITSGELWDWQRLAP
jgi:Tol biopolymer transport system component